MGNACRGGMCEFCKCKKRYHHAGRTSVRHVDALFAREKLNKALEGLSPTDSGLVEYDNKSAVRMTIRATERTLGFQRTATGDVPHWTHQATDSTGSTLENQLSRGTTYLGKEILQTLRSAHVPQQYMQDDDDGDTYTVYSERSHDDIDMPELESVAAAFGRARSGGLSVAGGITLPLGQQGDESDDDELSDKRAQPPPSRRMRSVPAGGPSMASIVRMNSLLSASSIATVASLESHKAELHDKYHDLNSEDGDPLVGFTCKSLELKLKHQNQLIQEALYALKSPDSGLDPGLGMAGSFHRLPAQMDMPRVQVITTPMGNGATARHSGRWSAEELDMEHGDPYESLSPNADNKTISVYLDRKQRIKYERWARNFSKTLVEGRQTARRLNGQMVLSPKGSPKWIQRQKTIDSKAWESVRIRGEDRSHSQETLLTVQTVDSKPLPQQAPHTSDSALLTGPSSSQGSSSSLGLPVRETTRPPARRIKSAPRKVSSADKWRRSGTMISGFTLSILPAEVDDCGGPPGTPYEQRPDSPLSEYRREPSDATMLGLQIQNTDYDTPRTTPPELWDKKRTGVLLDVPEQKELLEPTTPTQEKTAGGHLDKLTALVSAPATDEQKSPRRRPKAAGRRGAMSVEDTEMSMRLPSN